MLTPTQSRLRLVSIFLDPDGDIQIQGTVKISADPSNSNRVRFIFLDPDQFRSRIYFVRIMLTLPWSRFGLYLYFMDPDGDIPIQSVIRIC